MKSYLKWILFILIVIVIIFFARIYFTGNAIKNNSIKFGVTIPMSGDLASFGNGEKAAIELATSEINSNGGINGKNIELIFEDTKCDAKEASSAANKLINIEKVPVIVGELCSGSVLAMAPLAEKSKTILFSTAASSPKITESGEYIFRDYPSDSYQGKYAADVSFNKLNKKKVAVLFIQIDYGIGVKDSFVNEFKNIGGEITSVQSFNQNTKDMRTQLSKIKNEKPDMIYFVGYNQEAIVFLQELKELGINTQIFATETFDDPSIAEQVGGESINNAIYALMKSPENKKFKDAIKQRTGSEQILIGMPNSYDAIYLIANAMKNCKNPEDTTCIKDELNKIKNYSGVTGIIGFDLNGDLISADYQIKQYKGKEAIELNL